mgnify:FL=1
MDQLIKEPRSKSLKTKFVNPKIASKLVRKYKRDRGKFEIQIELPHLRIINRHENMETALPDYEKMLKMLGKGTPEEISEFKETLFA